MSKLYKKEEEALLNKKKKREEIKQKTKTEKTRISRSVNNQYNVNNNNYSNTYLPHLQQMNYLNMGFFENYPNAYYYPPNAYQFSHPGMINYNAIPYFQQQFIPQEQPKDLQSNLNNIYQRGIVNNIIGAFYLKECQENEKTKIIEKKKAPVAMVNLNNNNDDENNKNSEIKMPLLVDDDKKNNENDVVSDKNEEVKENNDANNNNVGLNKENNTNMVCNENGLKMPNIAL